MDDIYEAIARLRRRGDKAVLAMIVNTRGSAPRKEGAKMLVQADGKIVGTIGGGSIEHQAYQEALKLIAGNESKLAHYELTNDDASKEGMTCGGTVDVFLEPIKPLPSLIISCPPTTAQPGRHRRSCITTPKAGSSPPSTISRSGRLTPNP